MSFTTTSYMMLGIVVSQDAMDRKYPYIRDEDVNEKHAYCAHHMWTGVSDDLKTHKCISIMDETNTHTGLCHIGVVLAYHDTHEEPSTTVFNLDTLQKLANYAAQQINLLFPDEPLIANKLQSIGLVHYQTIV
jgi:hypothetical protein